MESASTTRILVVANRSVATPVLLEEVRRRAEAGPCAFALLIPDAPPGSAADWTLRQALRLFERASGAPVEGIVSRGSGVFRAIELALGERRFDEVIVSTLPRRGSHWLRRDLPRRVRRLGVPVTVVTPVEEASPSAVMSR
jgi:hypothetical protein